MRLLLVDDEPRFRSLMRKQLGRMGHAVSEADCTDAALDLLNQGRFDVALVDLRLGPEDGIDALEAILALESAPQVIMLTGHGTIDAAIRAIKLGAFDFLTKPCDLAQLEVTLEKACEHSSLARENIALRSLVHREDTQHRIVGESLRLRAVVESAEAIAPSDAAVLILGESGTGKELIAQLIHRRSGRADKPFIAVNCAAFHEQLLASELFGHKRGAFTGADSNKIGLIEAANGGTLFLDEIGDMSPAVQAALLRALESGEVRSLGSTRTQQVSVRVISATNSDLRTDIGQTFREDLYYRLNTIEIQMPPLREHAEDIPDIVQHLLAQTPNGARIEHVDPAVFKALQAYAWPGNVRELRNVIERAAILCKTTTLTADVLPPLARQPLPATAQYTVSLPMPLEAVERLHIESMLTHFQGNKSLAAQALGVTRRTLYNKLETYGLLSSASKVP